MAKFVRVIFFLLLTVALYGVAGNGFTDGVELLEYTAISSMEQQDKVGVPEYPYLPIAEQVSNSSTHQLCSTRIQRVLTSEYFLSLKHVLQNCANRDSSLSRHWGRIYNTTTSYFCQPASEYYVFALRHIII